MASALGTKFLYQTSSVLGVCFYFWMWYTKSLEKIPPCFKQLTNDFLFCWCFRSYGVSFEENLLTCLVLLDVMKLALSILYYFCNFVLVCNNVQ